MSAARPPSSYAVMNASNELARVREMLIAICPDIESEDNEKLFADMLEGEAPDAMRIIERLIDMAVMADRMGEMIQRRQMDLTERKARFDKQRDAYRAVALQQLESLNLRKLVRPEWTASIANRPPRVLITDESALDEIYVRVRREPDKAAIAAGLKNGDVVRGAEWSNGGTGLTVRTK